MAVSITPLQGGSEGQGDLHLVVFDFHQNDVNYPTNGWSISGLGGPALAVLGELPGYLARFDQAAQKLLLYRQTAATGALVEVPNNTDLSALASVRLVAVVAG